MPRKQLVFVLAGWLAGKDGGKIELLLCSSLPWGGGNGCNWLQPWGRERKSFLADTPPVQLTSANLDSYSRNCLNQMYTKADCQFPSPFLLTLHWSAKEKSPKETRLSGCVFTANQSVFCPLCSLTPNQIGLTMGNYEICSQKNF